MDKGTVEELGKKLKKVIQREKAVLFPRFIRSSSISLAF